MKPLYRFILLTILVYAMIMVMLSNSFASKFLCSGFQEMTTIFLKWTLPEAHIESQQAFDALKRPDPNSFHLIYGNPEIIRAEHQYARSQNLKEYKISTYSIQLFFFQLFTVPVAFLLALFIATPMPWKQKVKFSGIGIVLLLIAILSKVYLLMLYNFNVSAIGVYRLSASGMEWITRIISMLTLGFSIMLCFVLWLLLAFRNSKLASLISDYLKNFQP